MSASTITAFTPIAELSLATPGLFNSRFQVLQDNIVSVNSGVISPSVLSQTTYAVITLVASSNSSSYIRLVDSSAQRSSYRIGSFDGGTDDGLNIWDESGQTMIVSFSKQSIRFFQNVVGPVFNTAGDFVNVAVYGTGADSKESRIQAAIDDAGASLVSFVFLPRAFIPYSAGSISFNSRVQMVREGGDWTTYDLKAYGATGNGIVDDRPALHALANLAIPPTGGAIRMVGPGTYLMGSTVTVPSTVALDFAPVSLITKGSGVTLSIQGAINAHETQQIFAGAGDVMLTSRCAPQVSVMWFGARGDGTTDDTVAIQSTVSSVQSIGNHTMVIPAPGPYLISDPIRVSAPIRILGLGNNPRLRGVSLVTNEYILDVGRPDPSIVTELDGIEDVTIQNLAFEQSGAGPWPAALMRLRNVANSRFRDIKLKEAKYGIHITGRRTYSNTYDNIHVNAGSGSEISDDAIRIEGAVHNLNFIGGSFTAQTYGVHMVGDHSASGINFYGTNFEGCGESSFYDEIRDTSGIGFYGCRSEECDGEWDFAFIPPSGGYARGIVFHGCYLQSTLCDYAIVMTNEAGGIVEAGSVMGCVFEGHDNGVLRLASDGGKGSIIAGNSTSIGTWVSSVQDGVLVINNTDFSSGFSNNQYWDPPVATPALNSASTDLNSVMALANQIRSLLLNNHMAT